ncbi:uncharacterized protein LOC143860348 [Tasmannia lanceolata]|uniref:uncharacterized protein LOC143860348 n=1 Tax=Tasmannia lanceolata TaxID=3420 RepID=UPI004064A708
MSGTHGTHILVFPFPAQGHIIPLLDLTHHLASKQGLSITILITPKNLPILTPLLSKFPSVQTLLLPFPNYPSFPQGVENFKDLPPATHPFTFLRALAQLYNPILDWFRTHPSPPVAILCDFFLGWTQHLAHEIGIPRIVFYPSGAFAVSILNSLFLRKGPLDPTSIVPFPDIPNSPSFPYKHLPGSYRVCKEQEGQPDAEFVREGILANISSWGSVFNTFDSLEGAYLEHVTKVSGQHERVWAVGPLLSPGGGLGPVDRGGASSVPVADVLTWLDGCPEQSVVYVCFGSQVTLTRHQVEGLAAGLEGSGVRFVFCLKEGEVPAGFEERVAGRGWVIKGWAPQVAILSHRSVGVFLTHCGWNSVLEGLAAGVTLLAWPMKADQFLNARLLVEELGIAVRVCEGNDTVPDSGELAKAVAESVGGTWQQRIQSEEMCRAALEAVKVGGASSSRLEGFVGELHSLSLVKESGESNNRQQEGNRSFLKYVFGLLDERIRENVVKKIQAALIRNFFFFFSLPIMSETKSAHILVFPFPAQGHMIPLLDLTQHLASKQGLSITILIIPKNLPILTPLLSKFPSIQTLLLPFPNYPSFPQGVENVKDLPPATHPFTFFRALAQLYNPILDWFRTHPSPPVAILSDFFLGWTQHLAREIGIARIVFYASGAFTVSILNSLFLRKGPLDPTSIVPLPDIPNSPSFPYHHLPGIYRVFKEQEGEPDAEFVREGFLANISSWGTVFNTFDSLEGAYLEHVRKVSGQHERVWAVGPLLSPGGGVGPVDRGGPSSVPVADVLTWLDGCPEQSVVYVCFGSQVKLTRHQVECLAAGLEGSGARFVFCLKEGEVPAGFEERVAGRGWVIKGWAPQVAILSHLSVGVFLTHCGWNSVVEGLVAGVTLLAWPMKADQFLNARLLVEELGVAVRVCEGLDTVPDSDELAKAVAESVSGTPHQRVRAEEMCRAALEAVKVGGRSSMSLDGFVEELHSLSLIKGSDMLGIDPTISTHELGVDQTCKPVKQKRRHFAPERRMAIREEVERLLKADFIREIQPAIKAQVLADFIAECTMPDSDPGSEAALPSEAEPVISEQQTKAEAVPLPGLESAAPPISPLPCSEEPLWEVYVDGSSNKSGSGAGLVLIGPDDFVLNYALRFGFLRTLSITILLTPKNLPILTPLLSKFPSIQTLLLPFPHYPSFPQGVENFKDLPPATHPFTFLRALAQLYNPILDWFRAHPSPPVAILSDFFLGWTHHLAREIGIPRIVFYPSGAFTVSILNSLFLRKGPLDPTSVVLFPDIPNSPSFPCKHLPGSYQEGNPDTEFVREGFLANISSWGSVFNTFDSLEGAYLEHARKVSGQHERVWAVGPLLSPGGGLGPVDRGGPSSMPVADVLTWLDGCPEQSVVYVCFGSQVTLTRHQVEGLAAGLEGSRARFVFCLKEGEVPAGFEERVAGRGWVIKGWAPQVAILNHQSVGAFLTHCGWNSVLEGLVAGVTLLAWPMKADQFLNARLLVEELGVAVRICEGRDTVPDSYELAKAVAESVGETRPERVRAEELCKAALEAVKVGGNSSTSLEEFVEELRALRFSHKA